MQDLPKGSHAQEDRIIGHWYRETGELVEDADLTQAKKENLWPSVTTMIDVISRPGLIEWALNMGREAAEEHRIKTANDGKRLHAHIADWITATKDGLEEYLIGDPDADLQRAEDDAAVLMPAFAWLADNLDWKTDVMSEETIVGVDAGFAGTVDIFGYLRNGKLAIVDVKTKDGKPGRTLPKPYLDKEGLQLAGYEHLIDEGKVEWLSLMVNRDPSEPKIRVYQWPRNEQQRCREAFFALVKFWFAAKGYRPRPTR